MKSLSLSLSLSASIVMRNAARVNQHSLTVRQSNQQKSNYSDETLVALLVRVSLEALPRPSSSGQRQLSTAAPIMEREYFCLKIGGGGHGIQFRAAERGGKARGRLI